MSLTLVSTTPVSGSTIDTSTTPITFTFDKTIAAGKSPIVLTSSTPSSKLIVNDLLIDHIEPGNNSIIRTLDNIKIHFKTTSIELNSNPAFAYISFISHKDNTKQTKVYLDSTNTTIDNTTGIATISINPTLLNTNDKYYFQIHYSSFFFEDSTSIHYIKSSDNSDLYPSSDPNNYIIELNSSENIKDINILSTDPISNTVVNNINSITYYFDKPNISTGPSGIYITNVTDSITDNITLNGTNTVIDNTNHYAKIDLSSYTFEDKKHYSIQLVWDSFIWTDSLSNVHGIIPNITNYYSVYFTIDTSIITPVTPTSLTWDVKSPAISISGNTLTIDLTGTPLAPFTKYQLVFDDGAIVSDTGEILSFSDFPTFTFTTGAK